MKRLLSLLLILCLLVPCLVLTACGPDKEPGDGEGGSTPSTEDKDTPTLRFILLEDDTYSVSKGGLGYAREIVIPATYNGKPVTRIAANGFSSAGFEKITIPESIQVIGSGAFKNCADFKEIALPGGLREIGDETFSGCVYLEQINIPTSVTRIGNAAFMGCTSLTSVTVPEGVTEIGAQAFWGCVNITSFSLPNTLKTVGNMAFAIIGEETLEKPHGLQYNSLDGNKYLGNAQNPRLVLVELGDKSVTEYAIPTDTRIIYSYALAWSSVAGISMHADVAGISAYAFLECTALTAVHIPDKVSVVGERAFYGCRSLKRVTGMNFIEEIGDYAFSGCSTASNSFEINIGSTLKSIGRNVFPSENALKCTTDKNVSYVGNTQNPYLIAVRAEKKSSTNNYTINANTKIIYESSFDNCDLITEILIPEGVFLIAYDAFYHCDNLSYVSLPKSLEIIMEDAFHTCKRLPSIVIPENVVYIGDGAFKSCSSMAKITLPFVGRTPNGGGNALFGSIFGAQNIGQQVSRVPKALR
ncbi:MAG: leucine-rich repeat domain-containing protein, partial [Clostridia bacterium]|nr:leucine-rich repeat domain-containing protein [Clostridia bacterium]